MEGIKKVGDRFVRTIDGRECLFMVVDSSHMVDKRFMQSAVKTIRVAEFVDGNIQHCSVGSYAHSEKVEYFGKKIDIDRCILPEIVNLWKDGIVTIASCCGHGSMIPTVCVMENDFERMEILKYDSHVNESGVREFHLKTAMPR